MSSGQNTEYYQATRGDIKMKTQGTVQGFEIKVYDNKLRPFITVVIYCRESGPRNNVQFQDPKKECWSSLQ